MVVDLVVASDVIDPLFTWVHPSAIVTVNPEFAEKAGRAKHTLIIQREIDQSVRTFFIREHLRDRVCGGT